MGTWARAHVAGIEFDPSVLLIGMAKGDPWYTDIFCIPECPSTGALKERFQKFNTGGDRGPLKLGQVSCPLTVLLLPPSSFSFPVFGGEGLALQRASGNEVVAGTAAASMPPFSSHLLVAHSVLRGVRGHESGDGGFLMALTAHAQVAQLRRRQVRRHPHHPFSTEPSRAVLSAALVRRPVAGGGHQAIRARLHPLLRARHPAGA